MYSGRTRMIEEGIVAYVSQLGHYNFYYPDREVEFVFASDAIIKIMNWAEQGGLVAVSVQSSFLKPKEGISSKTHIVWVNPSVIKSY